MDQVKIGSFLKTLRTEKELTQENLAEVLHVSGRTISRWETGSNMPDIGMLVEIADFFDVSIPEIIEGERKSEMMNQESRDTAKAMAQYSQAEVKKSKRKVVGILLSVFGLFIMLSALLMFPAGSRGAGPYPIIGGIVLIIGIYLLIRPIVVKPGLRLLVVLGATLFLFGTFLFSDYISVVAFNQIPRFYQSSFWTSREPDQTVYKTWFYTVIIKNAGTDDAEAIIVK